MQQAAALARVLRARGDTLRAIADHLDKDGFRTRQGNHWTATQVKRILDCMVA